MTSKKFEESIPDDKESYHKHRRKYGVEIDRYPRTTPRKHGRMVDDYSITSDSYSSSDGSDYSSDTERRTRGRRRRRRWHGDERCRRRESKVVSNHSRQSSRSRSRSKCRCSDEESNRRERSQHREENKIKVKFRDTSDDDLVIKKSTELTSRSEMSVRPQVHQKVTAVVHREAEEEPQDSKESKETKPSESSENGYQDVQYQKLDTGTEVTDTEVFTDYGKGDQKKNKVPHPSKTVEFSPVNDSQKVPTVTSAVTSSKRDSPRGVQKENVNRSADPFGEQPFTINDLLKQETAEMKHPAAEESQKRVPNIQSTSDIKDISKETETSTAKKVNDLKKDVEENISQETPKTIRKPTESQNPQEKAAQSTKTAEEKSNNDDERLKVENISHGEQHSETTAEEEKKLGKSDGPEVNVDTPPQSSLQKTIKDLEKLKTEQLAEHFTKDKGLICVILDDDETIEIKRKKESRTKSEHSTHRTRSASRKKEKNSLKRQRRSRSSFEVLSDEGNNDGPSSRLTVHDDSGFEPSPRHGSSTFEGKKLLYNF